MANQMFLEHVQRVDIYCLIRFPISILDFLTYPPYKAYTSSVVTRHWCEFFIVIDPTRFFILAILAGAQVDKLLVDHR